MSNKLTAHDEAKLQKLLQVKRLETPGKAYFNGFLDEFHRYQRADILKEPSVMERLQAKLEDLFFFQPQKAWAMGSGFAVVLLLASVTLVQFSSVESSSVAGNQAPVVEIDNNKFHLASDSSFERDFSSPRYVTGQTPLSYDSVLAF